jgi:cytochrome bd-type quinol oxidase subunit 2
MKKLLLTSTLSFFALLVALPALAQNLGTGQGSILQKAGTGAGFSADTTETTFAEILGTVVQTALSFIGIIFLSLMVYAGYLWMTARGEQDQIERAKKMITAAIIGLIITVGAYSITAFVVPRLLNRATSGLPFLEMVLHGGFFG